MRRRSGDGNAERATRVAVDGDEAECSDGLGEIVSAGAELLILNALFDELEHLDRLMRVAEDLSPTT